MLFAPSFKRGHDGAAYSSPLDRRFDQPARLRVFDESARVSHAEIPALRHRHSVRIDAGPTVENPGTRPLIRYLEQAWLDVEDDVCSAGFQHAQCAIKACC